MKICTISDLHNRHREWTDNLIYGQWGYEIEEKWKNSDILLFAGDATGGGSENELRDFLFWFNKQPQKYKIMIAGNHDFCLEKFDESEKQSIFNDYPEIIYLEDSGINIEGINIWGSPVQPAFNSWAFNKKRGNDIQKHWDMIPKNTDILITHGPPRNILDEVNSRNMLPGENPNVGCDNLLSSILIIEPKLVVFGHIHEGYGRINKNGTEFINASCLNAKYFPCNPPQFIEL